jgi:hypothetical protein
MKNVIAIAFGMLDALKDRSNFVGDNIETTYCRDSVSNPKPGTGTFSPNREPVENSYSIESRGVVDIWRNGNIIKSSVITLLFLLF